MITSGSSRISGVRQIQLFLLLFLLPLVFSIKAHSDSVSCNDFVVQELKEICSDNSPQVDVYNDVTGVGLNDLAESWSTDAYNYHARVIPPGTYVINRPIVMEPGNRLLPHPTMPLPAGKKLRTIELVAADGFQVDQGGFYLLKLSEVSLAGGLEIDGSKLPDAVVSSLVKGSRAAPRNTLILASGSTDTFLAGSVLTGHQSLDALYWNTSTSSDRTYANNVNGVRLKRNYLRQAGASTAVILSLGAEKDYDIRNNSIFVELGSGATGDGSGIYLAGGRLKAAVENNDFILPPRSISGNSTAQRRAIEIAGATGFTVNFNAMYTPGSTALDSYDIGIYDSRESTDGKRLMGFFGNQLSPHLTASQANPYRSDEVMKMMLDGNTKAPMIDAYFLENPYDFLSYQGKLGAVSKISAALSGGGNSTCIMPNKISDTDLTSDNLSPVRQYIYENSEPYSTCQTTEVSPVQIFFAVGLFVVEVATGITCTVFCGRRGMGKSTCACRRRR